ncbi:MAG: uracil-DNA glycosylase [Spirochaetes bacterium]|nr:uracil-DNA glycosylase [Spirochaetota bacterium]
MKPFYKNRIITCDYPCSDTIHNFIYPGFKGNDEDIAIMIISESPPQNHNNYYYRNIDGNFFLSTQTAFNDAGIKITSYEDLTEMGIYLTTAIKCPKNNYLVSAGTIKECADRFLENEIFRFSRLKVIMCMGDFAIKSVNYIFRKKYGTYPIKKGSTYKIRKEQHIFNGITFIPSYTQTGDSFNIEKSKRLMISEDIALALSIV